MRGRRITASPTRTCPTCGRSFSTRVCSWCRKAADLGLCWSCGLALMPEDYPDNVPDLEAGVLLRHAICPASPCG